MWPQPRCPEVLSRSVTISSQGPPGIISRVDSRASSTRLHPAAALQLGQQSQRVSTVQVIGAVADHDQQRSSRLQVTDQERDQLTAGAIRPAHILDDQHHGPLTGEILQQTEQLSNNRALAAPTSASEQNPQARSRLGRAAAGRFPRAPHPALVTPRPQHQAAAPTRATPQVNRQPAEAAHAQNWEIGIRCVSTHGEDGVASNRRSEIVRAEDNERYTKLPVFKSDLRGCSRETGFRITSMCPIMAVRDREER